MNKQDLALNNAQGLMRHKTQPTNLLIWTVIWYQLFLFDMNNFITDLFDS